MLGPLIIYLKGMRRMMFQLSGFYYRDFVTVMAVFKGLSERRSIRIHWCFYGFTIDRNPQDEHGPDDSGFYHLGSLR